MLTLDHVGMEYGGRWLFRDATYQFIPGETVGLIGRNGAGKSTLLKIIVGELSPSEGAVRRAGTIDVAFFNQDLLSVETDRPIFEVAREAFAPLLALQTEIEDILGRMEAGETDQDLLDQLSSKQTEFDHKGGPQMDARVHSILSGLGFPADEHDAPYKTFSGGWRMRVQLAKLLLMDPEVLLLDEPTNHLDLPSIQWLENYLKTFQGATIIVSHDRFFLDRVAEKILEISLKQLHIYAGNYTYYQAEKELRQDQHRKAYENQQKHIAEQEAFINRFRAKATKARQAQSKLKQLEKLERIEAPEEEVVDLTIRFTMRETSGKEVLRLKSIAKRYDEKVILVDASATVMRGDKIALIGANGTGKSTLLRILADHETYGGQREEGYRVTSGFFAQHQLEALNLKRTIIGELEHHVRDKTDLELRTTLGSFMFSGDDIHKPIQVLSGGEKSRVALAKTLLSEANFLLLDEPTNHLDIASIQILSQALNAYEGTYVVVSHDRFFLRHVANKIWYIEDQQVKEYPGTYEEFEAWQERKAAEAVHMSQVSNLPTTETPPPSSTIDYKAQKQRKNRLKKVQQQITTIEAEIEALENKAAALAISMADPAVAVDYDKISAIQAEHQTIQQTIEDKTTRWESLAEELEELTNEG